MWRGQQCPPRGGAEDCEAEGTQPRLTVRVHRLRKGVQTRKWGTQAPEQGANQGMGYTGSRRGANQGMSDEEEGEVLIPGRTAEGSLEEAAMKDAKNAEKGRGTLQSIWMACQSRTPGAECQAASTLSRRRAAAPTPHPHPAVLRGPRRGASSPNLIIVL